VSIALLSGVVDADQVDLIRSTVEKVSADLDGDELTGALDHFGWSDVLDDSARTIVPVLFESMGRHGRWCAAFHDVLAHATGDPDVTVVLPYPGAATAGARRGADADVVGLFLGARAPNATVLAPIADDRGLTLLSIPGDLLVLGARPGLAPSLAALDVTGVAPFPDGAAGDLVTAGAWRLAEAFGRLALSHYLAGTLRTMFELARDHAAERVQFGQPVGTFQAVRHKLADAFVAVEALDAAATWAWEADDVPLAAATAKVVASKSVHTVAANTQQVLAGVGFTAEHPFHPYLKRALVLDRVLGGGARLAASVGQILARHGAAPRLVEL
jgi:hypothetical protein